jgi:hypothetical protein
VQIRAFRGSRRIRADRSAWSTEPKVGSSNLSGRASKGPPTRGFLASRSDGRHSCTSPRQTGRQTAACASLLIAAIRRVGRSGPRRCSDLCWRSCAATAWWRPAPHEQRAHRHDRRPHAQRAVVCSRERCGRQIARDSMRHRHPTQELRADHRRHRCWLPGTSRPRASSGLGEQGARARL